MKSLQQYIAEFFPEQYQPATWEALIPEFVAQHIQRFQQALKAYHQLQATWEASDQSTPAPVAPMPPYELGLASEAYAKQLGLNYQAVAFCMLIAEERALHFRQESEWYRKDRDYYQQLYELDQAEL